MSKSTGEEEETVWSKSAAEFVRSESSPSLGDNASLTTPPSKPNSKYFDPCQEVANRSLKCLRRNGGDRAMCQDYFECVVLLDFYGVFVDNDFVVRIGIARNRG